MCTFGAADSRFPGVVLADAGQAAARVQHSTQSVQLGTALLLLQMWELVPSGNGRFGAEFDEFMGITVEKLQFTAQGGKGCVTRSCKIHHNGAWLYCESQ